MSGLDTAAVHDLSPAEQLALVTVVAAHDGPAAFLSEGGLAPASTGPGGRCQQPLSDSPIHPGRNPRGEPPTGSGTPAMRPRTCRDLTRSLVSCQYGFTWRPILLLSGFLLVGNHFTLMGEVDLWHRATALQWSLPERNALSPANRTGESGGIHLGGREVAAIGLRFGAHRPGTSAGGKRQAPG